MDNSKEFTLNMLSKVAELNAFLQGSVDNRLGDNVIDITMDVIDNQRKEILRLEDVIKSMKSEIEYSLLDNKTEDIKKYYLENAIRYADDALYIK
ncbi:hypothetical protein ABE073_04890 [Lederbergia citrisecunda]|uniref:hypothetical protein n=1 Tax=Lederbergia citrisecunda TaxID=2833583 RepID=UPI003D267110